MSAYAMFTDVSLNPQEKRGLGAYLVMTQTELECPPDAINKPVVVEHIHVEPFKDTSSTLLEIQTVLFALKYFQDLHENASLTIYTDSQCISGLLGRRERLEANNYISKKTKKELKNAAHYQLFYCYHDQLQFDVVKVTGHTQYRTHDTIHRIFSIVDQHARKTLRFMS